VIETFLPISSEGRANFAQRFSAGQGSNTGSSPVGMIKSQRHG
jgi:hypothetical protein